MSADDINFIRGYDAYESGLPLDTNECQLWRDGWNAAHEQDFDEDFLDA